MAHRALILMAALASPGASAAPIVNPTPAPTSIPGPTARAWFGYQIATTPERIAVSAPLSTVAGKLEAGAVYLYPWAIDRRGPPPAPARILAPQPKLAGRFGAAVALEEDTLVVGAPGKGCAYVFTPDARGRFVVVATLWPPQGADRAGRASSAWFGSSVAITGGWIAVGAPAQANTEGLDPAGSVHLFHRDVSGQWRRAGALHPPRGEPGDGFGMEIAAAGDLLVVGAPRDQMKPWGYRGSAHVFVLDAHEGWRYDATLEPPGRPGWWGRFGGAVDVDARGRVAVAGGRSRWDLAGAAVLFERDERGAWVGQAIHPALPPDLSPQERQRASTTAGVRLQGGRLLLTVREPTPGLAGPGALVFEEHEGRWMQQAFVGLPRQNAPKQIWRLRPALRGPELILGVTHHDTSAGARARGSAHLYRLAARAAAPGASP